MGPIACPETSAGYNHYTFRNIPEESRSQLLVKSFGKLFRTLAVKYRLSLKSTTINLLNINITNPFGLGLHSSHFPSPGSVYFGHSLETCCPHFTMLFIIHMSTKLLSTRNNTTRSQHGRSKSCMSELALAVTSRHEKRNITLFFRRNMQRKVQGNENFKNLEFNSKRDFL
jgi:hypothetical protein